MPMTRGFIKPHRDQELSLRPLEWGGEGVSASMPMLQGRALKFIDLSLAIQPRMGRRGTGTQGYR